MTVEERTKARTEFKNSLKDKSKEELETMLNEITEESKALDKEVSEKEFDLSKLGKSDTVFENIRYFLDLQKVKWNYALGMITIYEFFSKKQKSISYPLLDTTLRMLGQLDFTGYSEWSKVKMINDYFTPISTEYRELTDRILDTAERYSMVETELRLFDKKTISENNA